MENLGTLTIRCEAIVPDRHDSHSCRGRLVTLATYRYIEQGECEALIERFLEANKIRRGDLVCTWMQMIHL